MNFIDTHTHLDGLEFAADLPAVISRAKAGGVSKVFLPAIDRPSVETVLDVCRRYPGYAYPMIGLHPEEVNAGWRGELDRMRSILDASMQDTGGAWPSFIAIGEVGLDYYWSRKFEHEQLDVFARQVEWSVETRLPLMIHCRKGQNEMVRLLRHYGDDIPGGVFHCFTGNEHEAEELLSFSRFALGIGGVLTFKKSRLPEVLPAAVPLDRIVLETDSPYMTPAPHRGERNESAYVSLVLQKLAEVYGVAPQEVADHTNSAVQRIFGVSV